MLYHEVRAPQGHSNQANAILLREEATMRVDFTSPSAGAEGDG
jgi:hypothetical protein